MLSEQEIVRRAKLEKIAQKTNPYPERYEITHGLFDAKKLEDGVKDVAVAGRILTIRKMGKLTFLTISDILGQLQLSLKQDVVGEESYNFFHEIIDMGDFIGAKGEMFTTHTGEKTLRIDEWDFLGKALRPLPEKFHGITDEDLRFRKRYLEFIMNRESTEVFLKKQLFWSSIRTFLLGKGFLEVETPILEVSSGGAAATPFKTHHNALDLDVFLRISMGELWQKKLLVGGFPKTFEIGRQFRNEGMSPEHLQDYTQMECYWAYADCKRGMEFVKELYRVITKAVTGGSKFVSRGFEIDMDKEWEIYDFETLIKEKTGIGIYDVTKKEITAKLDSLKVPYDPKLGFWRLVDVLWKVVRKDLSGPGFLIGQPVQLNPLPKRRNDDPRKVDQMQVIIAGSEMGNGYSELNDALDLEQRFIEQREMGESGDTEAHNHDKDFIEALKYGMPPAFGFGVSERLFSFMMDKPIRECVLFPLMKPEK